MEDMESKKRKIVKTSKWIKGVHEGGKGKKLGGGPLIPPLKKRKEEGYFIRKKKEDPGVTAMQRRVMRRIIVGKGVTLVSSCLVQGKVSVDRAQRAERSPEERPSLC